MRRLLPLMIFGSLLFAACGDDEPMMTTDTGVTPPTPDGGVTTPDGGMTTPDSGTPPGEGIVDCDPAATPNPGGGGSGGALNGDFTLFVFEFAAQPMKMLSGVTVVVDAGGESWTGTTDANGCLRVASAALDSTVNIHLFDQGRPFESAFNVGTAQITAGMMPPTGTPLAQPTAKISGNVTNLSVVGATSSTISQAAVIDALEPSVFIGAPVQPARADNPNIAQNILLVGGQANLMYTDYTYDANVEAIGMIATAGLYRQAPLQPGVFSPSYLGFVTGLSLNENDVLTGQDIELTHALTETLSVAFVDGLSGLSTRRVYAYVSFADGQFIRGAEDDPPNHMAVFDAPELTGVLAGGSYGGISQFTSDDGNQYALAVEPGSGTAAVNVPAPPELPSVPTVSGQTVSLTVDASQGFVFLGFGNAGGDLVWRITEANGGPNVSFDLPEVPSGFTNPLVGELLVDVVSQGYAPGIDFVDNFPNPFGRDLRSRAGRNQVSVEFPDPNQPVYPHPCSASTPAGPGRFGATGGAINGRLVLRAMGTENDAPIRDVGIVVRLGSGAVINSRLDADGCADIQDASLVGPVDIHFFGPPNRSALSLFNTNAAVRTVRLQSSSGSTQTAEPEPAVLSGLVTGFEVLGSTTANTGRAVIVAPLATDLFGGDAEQPARPNTTVSQNLAFVDPVSGFDFRDYTLFANPEKLLGLVAVGGNFDTGDGIIQLSHIGVLDGVTADAQEILENQDLMLTAPLDQTLNVSANVSGPESIVIAGITMPSGGLVGLEPVAGSTRSFSVPALTGAFANATYFVAAQQGIPGNVSFTGEQGLTGLNASLTVPPAPSAVFLDGSGLHLTIPAGFNATQAGFTIRSGGNTTWSAIVFNPSSDSITLTPPPPPTMGDVDPTPPPGTTVEVVARAQRAPGFDPDENVSRDFERHLEALTEVTTTVTF